MAKFSKHCKHVPYDTRCKQACHGAMSCLVSLFRHVSRGTLTMAVGVVTPLFTSVSLLTLAEASHWESRSIVSTRNAAPSPHQSLAMQAPLSVASSAVAWMMMGVRRPCQWRGCSRRSPAAPPRGVHLAPSSESLTRNAMGRAASGPRTWRV